MTGYISIVRNADIFIKSYKSNISESQKSTFLKYRHMGHRNIVQGIEICYRIMLLSFKKGGVYHARNIRTFNPLQLL